MASVEVVGCLALTRSGACTRCEGVGAFKEMELGAFAFEAGRAFSAAAAAAFTVARGRLALMLFAWLGAWSAFVRVEDGRRLDDDMDGFEEAYAFIDAFSDVMAAGDGACTATV